MGHVFFINPTLAIGVLEGVLNVVDKKSLKGSTEAPAEFHNHNDHKCSDHVSDIIIYIKCLC